MCTLGFTADVQAQITKRDDAVGQLLNEWYRDGTAAGLASITYENRDGQHSPLNTSLYPQIQVFEHSSTSGNATGPAAQLRLGPTVGNCSMASPATAGGSLPRVYMMGSGGGNFLMMQYLANNLFVYPEHQDHDIGANGVGGYGDLYPVNSPCCLISQGSSYSDQPFVQAVLSTIAAFPRETQRVLIQKRLLMPTVQSILRQSSRSLTKPADYLTGAAHPVVFDSAMLNEEAIVKMAQVMTPDLIPPLAQIEVVEESDPKAGSQVFEAQNPMSNKLMDARVSIARVFRGAVDEYGMVIDLGKSADIMGRTVKTTVQVLQGDPRLVRIDRSGNGTYMRLRVRWQPPIITRTGIRSHRVDIGVFASSGTSISAPAIISFYMLPNERRFYNERGKLAEIDYRTPNPDIGLPASDRDLRWLRVMLAATLSGDGLRSRIMEKLLNKEQSKAIQTAWIPLDRRYRALSVPGAQPDETAKAALEKDLALALAKPLSSKDQLSLKMALEIVFNRAAGFTDLYLAFRQEIDKLAAASPKKSAAEDILREVQRLIDLGVLIEEASGTLSTISASDKLTAADQHYLRSLNLTVMSQALFPEALERSVAPAWVDFRLTTPKPWRDVFRYDETSGALLGWVRHQAGRTHFFDAGGKLLPDGPKHPENAVEVKYGSNAQGLLEWK